MGGVGRTLRPLRGHTRFGFSRPVRLHFGRLVAKTGTSVTIGLCNRSARRLCTGTGRTTHFIRRISKTSSIVIRRAVKLPRLMIGCGHKGVTQCNVGVRRLGAVVHATCTNRMDNIMFRGREEFSLMMHLSRRGITSLGLSGLFVHASRNVRVPIDRITDVSLIGKPLRVGHSTAGHHVMVKIGMHSTSVRRMMSRVRRVLSGGVGLRPKCCFRCKKRFRGLRGTVHALAVMVPMTLVLVLLVLFFTFGGIACALVMFSAMPLSLVNNVLTL